MRTQVESLGSLTLEPGVPVKRLPQDAINVAVESEGGFLLS